MKTKYFYALVFGIIILTNTVRSQNLLFDGDFSQTTEIVPFDDPTPPLNVWAYWVDFYGSGSEATPVVIDGVCVFQISNPGNAIWSVQLGQWGFPLLLGHTYRLSFDVRAEAGRSFGVFLGENGGNYTNLIPDHYDQYATTDWQTITIDFEATSVYDLHKLSFELGGDTTTLYLDNVILQDQGPATVTSVSLLGSLQNEIGCDYDYNWECDLSSLNFNSDSGLWEGSFFLPAGCYSYWVKETQGSNEILFGENGMAGGDEIQFYVPSDASVTFSYNPQNHIITSSPYSEVPQEVTEVSLLGPIQEELGCDYAYQYDCENSELEFNPSSGLWEKTFVLSPGCYYYQVRERFGCNIDVIYGENGIEYGNEILLYIPAESEVTFSYDPQTHLINSTPYSGSPQELSKVSLIGSLQDELGCFYDYDNECENAVLVFNPESGLWEGNFVLPAGCYNYHVKESYGCDYTYYGKDGNLWGEGIDLFLPSESEISFSYDPVNHTMESSPFGDPPQEVTRVSLLGSLQNELGCANDYDYECDEPMLSYNSDTGNWEGSFILSEGCYNYRVKERFGCSVKYYGENGSEYWPEIVLYMPVEGEITFSYDPNTHVITSSPYSGVPEEVTKVTLIGSLQDEVGCDIDYTIDCDKSELVYNPDTNEWIGNFTLPTGCYSYYVRETFGCAEFYYGENGVEYGNEIQLYVPSEGEITFSYNTQTHIVTSTPYSGFSQEPISVSFYGSLQDELGCSYEYQYECDNPALEFNPDLEAWEGSFFLPAGCYSFLVKETSVCNFTFYGENGIEYGSEIQLYVPLDSEVTFSYDTQTHILTSTPYNGASEEILSVSLLGNLQDELGCSSDFNYECDNPALEFNPDSGKWIGNFTLPAGCYYYQVRERSACNVKYYGENGMEWGDFIRLFVPDDGEVIFSYDPQTHIITTSPYTGAPDEITTVSLIGDLQNELGCSFDHNYECDKPALVHNPESGTWEGKFIIPKGCYTFQVKETIGCVPTFYGENGVEWGVIELYIPEESEITFSYDPITHILSYTPYSSVPQGVTKVSLIGSLQDELGCSYDYDYECENPALIFNETSGAWEGEFSLPPGCYTYLVKETIGCNSISFYGENGVEWGNEIYLFIPSEEVINFSYDPQTHIVTTAPYFDISTANQCPETIYADNSPGTCGAIIDYPGFGVTSNCGGDVSSVIQTQGLPSGSMFPVGTTTNIFELTKITGEVESCSFDVVITDTEAPVIADLNEISEPLWPPNHKMIPIFLAYSVSDNCSEATTVISVSSNEAQSGPGKGDQKPDWEIIDNHNLLLRAERDPKGTGREYYITIRVTDEAGNYTEEVVTVRVPLNNGKATEDLTETDNYKLYPSPADEVVKIKGPESVSKRSYSIYDMLGVMKLQGTIRDDQIEVRNLPSGTYVLKFRTDKGFISKQFIKK